MGLTKSGLAVSMVISVVPTPLFRNEPDPSVVPFCGKPKSFPCPTTMTMKRQHHESHKRDPIDSVCPS